MPKSYLKSQDPPDVPVEDWLTWSASVLESSITDPSNKIAGVMGINKSGDITYLIMPTVVTNALGETSAILGNNFDASNEPSLVFVDTSDFGFSTVIEKYADIPNEIRPDEPLPSKFFRSTSWESATAELGLTRFPMIAPILFGLSTVEASIHDDDFEDKVGTMSPKHATWAKLIKEHFIQNENNEKCMDKIFDRVYKQGSRDKLNAKYVTDCSLDGKSLIFLLFKHIPFRAVNGKRTNRPFALSSKAIQALFAFLGALRTPLLPLSFLLLTCILRRRPLISKQLQQHPLCKPAQRPLSTQWLS